MLAWRLCVCVCVCFYVCIYECVCCFLQLGVCVCVCVCQCECECERAWWCWCLHVCVRSDSCGSVFRILPLSALRHPGLLALHTAFQTLRSSELSAAQRSAARCWQSA